MNFENVNPVKIALLMFGAGMMLQTALTSLMVDYPVFDVMSAWLFWGASHEYWWLILAVYATGAAVAVYGFCKLISPGRRI